MSEKLTLAVYLEKRGSVKALTRIEAEVFGVPYPLQKGWAHRHGAAPITQEMLGQLQQKIGQAKSSTAEKARRGLEGIGGIASGAKPLQNRLLPCAATAPIAKASGIPGFVLRQARRYRNRRQPPWA